MNSGSFIEWHGLIRLKMINFHTPHVKGMQYVLLFAAAASNAVHNADFDDVEIHGANGYLVGQFIQDTIKKEYSDSIENRARFALEVPDAINKVIDEERTAIRLSPWNKSNDMRVEDSQPTFGKAPPSLAYIRVVEQRTIGHFDREVEEGEAIQHNTMRIHFT
ncbi:hypothetical protein PHLCEN_2v5628 [Hermanssonia centrifuga]|uniref:NADH:flavin oxidoreductase/NADH oxidase N-terminal domain-containing protein n=1 Tax=Hermanssonia centrifuga TaxID=98765 RepID=A0A2R6P1U8_9APHY|nr:hypothetical protein PHLCEN_2v5628 [Hermanssonia centrifuga]